MTSFSTQFTAQRANPDDFFFFFLQLAVVSIGNWFTTGCLVNMSRVRFNILLVTKPSGN